MYKLISCLLFFNIVVGIAGCSAIRPANMNEYEMSEFQSGSERMPPVTGEDTAVQVRSENEIEVSDYESFLSDDGQHPLTIDSYLQQKCAWQDGYTSLYLEDETGAYYVYRLICSIEEYEAMQPGRKMRITGYKSEFSGEPEITDATVSMLDGEYFAKPVDISDVTEEDLHRHINHAVTFQNFEIAPMFDGRSAWFYEWDNSGSAYDESDLYFVAVGPAFSCSSVVNTQLRAADSDTYLAVQRLSVGDRVNLTGILTWYNGPQLLVTDLAVVS